MSFGQTDGLHSVTFNGNNVMVGGVNRDSHVTIPGLSFTAMMHPDNIGKSDITSQKTHTNKTVKYRLLNNIDVMFWCCKDVDICHSCNKSRMRDKDVAENMHCVKCALNSSYAFFCI